jgi:homoserine dehydrogenase
MVPALKSNGIFNGTTNYILTQMENGMSYTDALADAQKLGYAEADPTGDVEGFDAAGKVVFLARLLMKEQICMNDVERSGISGLSVDDVKPAKAAGERWKLIGSLERVNEKLIASVKPERLPISHPWPGLGGATNAAHFVTITWASDPDRPGAGRCPQGTPDRRHPRHLSQLSAKPE